MTGNAPAILMPIDQEHTESMSSFILIFVCFALGIVFRKLRIFPDQSFTVLNRFVIYISLPALTLLLVHRLEFSGGTLYPISMAWIHFIVAGIFFYTLGRSLGWSKKTVGALILTGGLGNTSFVGFPLLEALYGRDAIGTGVLVDQPGTFFVASTLGVATAALFSGNRPTISTILQKVFTFPPLLALIAAFLIRPFPLSTDIEAVLDRLGSTLVPLSLISVGMQLQIDSALLKRKWRPLAAGLVFKLVLMPVFFALLYVVILGQKNSSILITLVESAMASMITAGILAEEYGLDREIASLMIGIGIPISLATVPVWAWLFGQWIGPFATS